MDKDEKKNNQEINPVEDSEVIGSKEIIHDGTLLESEVILNETKKEEQVKHKKPKKVYNKKRILLLVGIIVACVLATGLLIFFKIKSLNSKTNEIIDTEKEDVTETQPNNQKDNTEDKKYAVTGFADQYNQNDLEISTISDGDDIQYIQISGLKDTTIENNINAEIKKTVYDLILKNTNAENHINTNVNANFSNVLSVAIHKVSSKGQAGNWEITDIVDIGLNYDLTTGNKITIDQLFVATAPIETIISDVAYKAFAWDTELDDNLQANMDNIDTSWYEEELFSIINKYHNKKESIKFSFTPNRLYFYGTGNDTMIGHIELSKYMNDLAIFKRYAGKDIFKSNDIGMKKIGVFTEPIGNAHTSIAYGKILDNLFLDINNNNVNIEGVSKVVSEKIRSDVKSKMNDILSQLKNKASVNKKSGYVYQNNPFGGSIQEKDGFENYIVIDNYYNEIEMSKEFFNQNIDRLLVEAYAQSKYMPSVDGLYLISHLPRELYDGVRVKSKYTEYNQIQYNHWYYDMEGNYLGDNEGALKKKQETPVNPPKKEDSIPIS